MNLLLYVHACNVYVLIPSCVCVWETLFQYPLLQLSAYPLGFGLKYLKTWDYLIQTSEQSDNMLQHAAREAVWVLNFYVAHRNVFSSIPHFENTGLWVQF